MINWTLPLIIISKFLGFSQQHSVLGSTDPNPVLCYFMKYKLVLTRLEEEKWSQGRPVFKKYEGNQRFLFVKEGSATWSIRRYLTESGAFILSGRGTNSPTSADAGPSDTRGVTRWRFWDDIPVTWAKGDISLTCK